MQMADTLSEFGKHLRLPSAMREELRVPLGPVLRDEAFRKAVQGLSGLVTVGDYCTAEALAAEVEPDVAIIDLAIQRQRNDRMKGYLLAKAGRAMEVANPAAHITPESWRAIDRALTNPQPTLIHVLGEEDLLALPAIALAPAGFTVIYGLPDEGAAMVEVTETSRERVVDLLRRMEVVDGD